MKSISISLLAFLFSLFALAACKTTPEMNSNVAPGISRVLVAARSAWMLKDHELVIQILEPYQEQQNGTEAAEIHYLLGMVWFEKADSDLAKLTMTQRMFQPNDQTIYSMLEKSLGFFQDVIWYDNEGSFLVGAYYFSGKILDVGYLQRIGEAMEYYKNAFSKDPETAMGRKALSRYRILAETHLNGGL